MSALQRLRDSAELRSYARGYVPTYNRVGLGALARALRMAEAEERNAQTRHGRTRAHREERCDCPPAPVKPAGTRTVWRTRRRAGA